MDNLLSVKNESEKKLGSFIPGTAGYEIKSPNLPAAWDYIYQNGDVLLKLDQYGPVYAQAHPPGDIMLFKREPNQRFSSWVVWLQEEDKTPFNNFFRPQADGLKLKKVPADFSIKFLPECGRYSFTQDGLLIETEFIIPVRGCEISMRVSIENLREYEANLFVRPHLIPYANQAQLAPWDKNEWYLKSGVGTDETAVFWSQLMDAGSVPDNRRTVLLRTDSNDLDGLEISLEKFIGDGSIEHPENALLGNYRMISLPDATPGTYRDDNTIYSYPPVWACSYEWKLKPGEKRTLTQVLSMPKSKSNGWFVGTSDVKKSLVYFDEKSYQRKKEEVKSRFDGLFSNSRIETGNSNFDYFANYWLPLQMNWVASLDRGWPTGMRGSRDSAQDYAALLYVEPERCREVILNMLSCQRTDGWFPRQYSAAGRLGKHDLRGHVDGGVFFAEYFWLYLAHTGDASILDEQLPWLNSEDESSVWEHVVKATGYYIAPENIGEHGLCKIREGDWLDAVNRAGLKGRGESTLVSIQTVMALRYMIDLCGFLGRDTDKISGYKKAEELLISSINTHARNDEGWYNGTFTDNGEWIFSSKDPDGNRRPYGPVNWYAVISGIADGDSAQNVLSLAEELKGPCGYRLYSPPMGSLNTEDISPVSCVGRAASGDAPPYMGENGNVYNHGSQGFLIRARAAAGDGDGVLDALEWLLPYDQEKHPTAVAASAPYAIANCWQEVPVFNGRVMMTFLTGSVAMAQRGIWEWMLGIKPALDGLVIEPVLPCGMKHINVEFKYRDNKFNMLIKTGKESGLTVNGIKLQKNGIDVVTGKPVYKIDAKYIGKTNTIEFIIDEVLI